MKCAKKYKPNANVILGGGAVSVFYNQLKKSLPKGTIISLGEGELLIEKLIIHFSDSMNHLKVKKS